jgi:hypothetical protein
MTDTWRVKTAVEFLKDNQGFKVGGLFLSCKSETVRADGFTNYSSTEFMTKQIAIDELNVVKNEIDDFKNSVKEFADFVADKKIIYSLSIDYGMGAIRICEELDSKLNWLVNLRD